MSSKKIILIIGILVVVALAVFLIFSSRGSSGGPDDRGFSIRNFFPFGNPEEVPSNNGNGNSFNGNGSNDFEHLSSGQPIPKLRKISDSPVAGMVMSSSGTTTIVRFVSKDTGNVYEASSAALPVRRLTNTTIPKINRVLWLPGGEGFLSQKVDQFGMIETSYIRLRATSTSPSNELGLPYEPVISSLPTGIEEISASPDGKKIFYYTREKGMTGFVSNPDGTSLAIVYRDNISEWIPNWFAPASLLLSSKASFAAQSYGILLNPSNKSYTRVYGAITGGSAVPKPDGKHTLLSQGGSRPTLLFISVADNKRTNLSMNTLAEKCAWLNEVVLSVVCGVPKSLPAANYPDWWYQGLVSTNDIVEIIDLANDSLRIISDLSRESGENIDIQTIAVSKDGNYAAFINKLDQSLWLLRLE